MIEGLPDNPPPPDANPTPAVEKPCAARLKHSRWCCLPNGHQGEHEYLARTEFEPNNLGPGRVPRYGR